MPIFLDFRTKSLRVYENVESFRAIVELFLNEFFRKKQEKMRKKAGDFSTFQHQSCGFYEYYGSCRTCRLTLQEQVDMAQPKGFCAFCLVGIQNLRTFATISFDTIS